MTVPRRGEGGPKAAPAQVSDASQDQDQLTSGRLRMARSAPPAGFKPTDRPALGAPR